MPKVIPSSSISRNMRSFALALQFLTRLPVPWRFSVCDADWGRSVLYYPLVGLVLGGLLLAAAVVLQAAPYQIQAAIILTVWVLLTGGLHLDGLADCADAWAGGLGDKQRSLAIMKDPAAGPSAVVLLVLVLLLKWTAIVQLLKAGQLTILLLTPVLGRLAILAMMLSTPYIRVEGLGEKMQQHLPVQVAIVVLSGGLLVLAWLLNITAVIVAAAVFFIIRWLAVKRLEGTTGDVYGATVELVEVSVLTVSNL